MLKKILAALILLSAAFGASAEFRWGPTAGINISKLHFRDNLFGVDPSVGPEIGVIGELMIPGIGFGVDFGLNWSMIGSKLHLGDRPVWSLDGYGTEQCYTHCINIPVNLRFKYTNLMGVERYVAPFVYGGPVFSINAGHSNLNAIKFSGGSIMAQVGIGVELFTKFQLSGGYYWGLTYQLKTAKLDNLSARPQGWLVRATYLF